MLNINNELLMCLLSLSARSLLRKICVVLLITFSVNAVAASDFPELPD